MMMFQSLAEIVTTSLRAEVIQLLVLNIILMVKTRLVFHLAVVLMAEHVPDYPTDVMVQKIGTINFTNI